MSAIDKILSIFGLSRTSKLSDTVQTAVSHEVAGRLWDATRTDRLNSAHWAGARSESINSYLLDELEIGRARTLFEVANNPTLTGLVKTHAIDVVGKYGPQLSVESEDREYAEELERGFRTWAMNAGHNGQSLAQILKTGIRELWQSGEIFLQKTSRANAGPIRFRLKPISPRRVGSPAGRIGDPSIFMGFEFNDDDDVVAYWIESSTIAADTSFGTINPRRFDAEQFLYYMDPIETEQIRGFPWLLTGLGSAGDMRDYDTQVLDAARQAADQSVLLQSDHPDASFVAVNATTQVERRVIKTLPPGWKAVQMTPNQPTTNYRDFRGERMRDSGRARGMPYIKIALDAREANYSSARIDIQGYGRTNEELAGDLERTILNPAALEVAREMFLLGILSAPPDDVALRWSWPKLPHVDPQKEARATDIRMQNKTLTLKDALREYNGTDDWQAHIDQLAAEQDYAAERGVDLNASSSDSSGTQSAGEIEENETPAGGANGAGRLAGLLQ